MDRHKIILLMTALAAVICAATANQHGLLLSSGFIVSPFSATTAFHCVLQGHVSPMVVLSAELACRGWKVTLIGTDEIAPFVNHLLSTRVRRVLSACNVNSTNSIQFISVGPCFREYVNEMAIITDELDAHGVAHAFNGLMQVFNLTAMSVRCVDDALMKIVHTLQPKPSVAVRLSVLLLSFLCVC